MDKETETVTVKSESISDERRESLILRKIVELWPLWLVCLGGITACYQFYFTVNNLSEGQKKWQESSETRREKTHDALDALDNRLIRVEKDVEWLRRNGHG